MPKTCEECPCHDMSEEWCNICYADYVAKGCEFREALKIDRFGGRPIGCPLVEVPSDHGRLIDLDQLLWYVDIKYSESECGTFPRYEIKDVLEDAPVIIDEE